MNDNNIMKYETMLPEDFDGVFKFTNWTDEDFIGKWGGKEYKFPKLTTSPMIIPDHSPIEIQHIRKKFAKDLGEREFFKDAKYRSLQKQERNSDGSPRLNSIQQAGTYSIETLTPFIQKCLEPLQAARATVTDAPKQNIEATLSRNDKGEINTTAIDSKTSLREKALQG